MTAQQARLKSIFNLRHTKQTGLDLGIPFTKGSLPQYPEMCITQTFQQEDVGQ